ncbi:MAG: Rrf2 family transcriptional regulator [Candidatus Omnitrophota bacterium]|jgi:Rrf2 family protein
MKLITRDTDYAIRAISYIASTKKKMVSARDLVEVLKIPRPFLRKILQRLNRAGLLKSYKGQGGGFALEVPPQRISLMRLMNVFQGPFRLNECFFKKKRCPNLKRCRLKRRIERIERFIVKELKAIDMGCLLK